MHDKEIRDSYDTYKVIESLMKSGFYNRNEKDGDTNIYVIPDKKKTKEVVEHDGKGMVRYWL